MSLASLLTRSCTVTFILSDTLLNPPPCAVKVTLAVLVPSAVLPAVTVTSCESPILACGKVKVVGLALNPVPAATVTVTSPTGVSVLVSDTAIVSLAPSVRLLITVGARLMPPPTSVGTTTGSSSRIPTVILSVTLP